MDQSTQKFRGGLAFAAGTGFAALALLVAAIVVGVRSGEINPAHVH